MLWQNNDTITVEAEDGIMVDYTENRFVIVIKDEIWTDYEIKALYRNPLHIYFGYERICAFFLLENVDSIDTSDAIFDIHVCEEKDELLRQEQYNIEVYLLNHQNKVCAGRLLALSKSDSKIIKDALTRQAAAIYDDAGFDRALYKLQHTYEPFEMEQLALIKACF